MALKFYGHLSLDGQQLQDVSAEKLATVVTGGGSGDDFEGRLLFINGGNATKGNLYYKNLAAGATPVSPATGWVKLSGEGNVSSIALYDDSTGLTSVFDEATDLQTFSLDYTTGNNFVLAAGTPSSAVIDAAALSTLIFITHVEGESTPYMTPGTNIKSAILAGVTSLTIDGAQPVDSHIKISDLSIDEATGVLTFESDLRAGAAPGADDAAKALQFLRATSATASEWDAWTTYTDTTYVFDVDVVNGGGIDEYARINFISTTDGVSNTDSTVQIVPSTSPPNSGSTEIERQVHIRATETVDGEGGLQIGLQDDVLIEGTLTLTAGAWNQNSVADSTAVSTSDVSFSNSDSTSDVTGALNVTGVATFPGIDTNWIKIDKTADQYGSDDQWANRAYVEDATIIAGAMTFKGTYDANVNPDTLVSGGFTNMLKGDTWVGGIGGMGLPEDPFWEGVTDAPVLKTGDFIIARRDNPLYWNNTNQNWAVVQSNLGNSTQSVAGLCSFPDAGETTPGGWKAFDDWDDPGKPEPLAQTSYSLTAQTTQVPVAVTNKWGRIESFTLTDIAADPTNNFTTETTFTDDVQDRFDERTKKGKLPSAADGTGWVFNHGLSSEDVIVQVYDAGTGESVFTEVERTDGANITLNLSGTHAQFDFSVVVTKVT